MIHKLESSPGYVISSRQVWLPGIYDSERAARYAFRFDDLTLAGLNDRICHIRGENRPITMDDLRDSRQADRGLADLPEQRHLVTGHAAHLLEDKLHRDDRLRARLDHVAVRVQDPPPLVWFPRGQHELRCA
jgi:hypothetical protein